MLQDHNSIFFMIINGPAQEHKVLMIQNRMILDHQLMPKSHKSLVPLMNSTYYTYVTQHE